MIIECPECGTKNQTLQPPQLGKRYRCGKCCRATITFLETIDTPNETPDLSITQGTGDIVAEETSGQGSSAAITKESKKRSWSDALKPDGRFSRIEFAFFYLTHVP